jgi:single-stranded DNA-binding protein
VGYSLGGGHNLFADTNNPRATMTSTVVISGKLIGNPKMSETGKGRPMLRALIECEQWRPFSRGEMKMEIHTFQVLAFSWNAETIQNLRPGAALTVICHLSGTGFEEPGKEVKFGIQLIVDEVLFAAPYKPAVKELTP